MKLSCPACGSTGSLEFFLMDASARASVITALNLPSPLAQQIMAYIGFFRPLKRSLTWDRVDKILHELIEPIKAAEVQRNGTTYAAPLEYWKEALDQMLIKRSSLTLPLKSHGYLFEIVANRASKSTATQRNNATRKISHPSHKVHVSSPSEASIELKNINQVLPSVVVEQQSTEARNSARRAAGLKPFKSNET